MSKYIDADELIKYANEEITAVYAYPEGKKVGDEQDYRGKWEFLSVVLKAVPAADVVEVIRCRECRYREKEQPGMVYCPNTVGGWLDENWFCAGGEKE